jgi:hypothetical protein
MVLPLHGVLAVAGAYAIGLCLYRLVRKVARRGRDLRLERVSAAAAAGVLAVCLIGLAATPSAHATLVNNLAERTPVGSAYPEVFEWLAQHTPAGKVVAYDRHKEFMTWSYADYGVAELFGIPPLAKENLPNYSDRWQAWLWLVNGPGAKPAGCLVRKYRIEFVGRRGQALPATQARLQSRPDSCKPERHTRAQRWRPQGLSSQRSRDGVRELGVTRCGPRRSRSQDHPRYGVTT